jgi:Protein of unknown function (DUF3800)
MAYFLFVDESGQDHKASPYEVLAGVAVEDSKSWSLVQELRQLEHKCFGGRYSTPARELKATKLLTTKTFRLAAQSPPLREGPRARLARQALDDPTAVSGHMLTALAQAKLAYVDGMLSLCVRYGCKAFASIIVDPNVATGAFLRKDYAYLFERFYHFLDDCLADHRGIVVFDEIGKSRSHLLVDQISVYFGNTRMGRTRASKVIPEPFFVRSELTTGIQLADVVAYILSWGYVHPLLTKPRRIELASQAQAIKTLLSYLARRELRYGRGFKVRSIAVIPTLLAGTRRAYRLRRRTRKGNVAVATKPPVPW